jgi:hypothetical protein
VKTPPDKPVASFLASDCLICSGERDTRRDEPVASIVQTASLPEHSLTFAIRDGGARSMLDPSASKHSKLRYRSSGPKKGKYFYATGRVIRESHTGVTFEFRVSKCHMVVAFSEGKLRVRPLFR